VVRHRVAQERAVPGTIDDACGTVHLEPKAAFEEPRQRGHHPQTGSLAADVHVRIVRVAAESVPPVFELFVNIISQAI